MGPLRQALAVTGFAALYLVAALLGRSTVPEGQGFSLVWPAAGVAVLWFLSLVRPAATAVSLVLLVAATVLANVLTGTTGATMTVATLANLMQVGGVVWLLRRWCPHLGLRGGRPPLQTTGGLLRFLGASALGCLAGVLAGVLGLAIVDQPVTPLLALSWWGRNTCGVLAVGTTGLLLLHRLSHHGSGPARAPGGRAEALALVGVTAGLIGVERASGVPFAFLMPATTVWAGLRFQPLLVSAHAALGGAAVIWLTLEGHGLFPAASPQTSALLAQMFVGMTIMMGLFLAASRQQGARLEAELLERQRELAAFSRRAAHDLQSPLMVVEGWAGLLASRLDSSPPEHEMAQRIGTATIQMRQLVGDLLADATARDRPLVPEQVELTALAREVAANQGAGAVVRVGDIEPVRGDAAMLRQLLENLLGNALKYVAPGVAPDVEVTASSDRDGMVSLEVSDRGIGIPAGEHEAVFGEFIRAHGDSYPGTGLGLGICRRIVERHGGTLSARPRRGGGTTFQARLPRWQSLPTPRQPGQQTAAPAPTERTLPWNTVTPRR